MNLENKSKEELIELINELIKKLIQKNEELDRCNRVILFYKEFWEAKGE